MVLAPSFARTSALIALMIDGIASLSLPSPRIAQVVSSQHIGLILPYTFHSSHRYRIWNMYITSSPLSMEKEFVLSTMHVPRIQHILSSGRSNIHGPRDSWPPHFRPAPSIREGIVACRPLPAQNGPVPNLSPDRALPNRYQLKIYRFLYPRIHHWRPLAAHVSSAIASP